MEIFRKIVSQKSPRRPSPKGKAPGEQGFTLIEMIVYFALLSIILLIVVDLFFRLSEASLESSAESAVETEGKYVLDRIAYDMHRFDTSNGDTLSLPANPGETSNQLVLIINSTSYNYSTLGQEITLANDRLTSNSVTVPDLEFTQIANQGGKPTIKVNFTLEAKKPTKSGRETKDFESVFSIR